MNQEKISELKKNIIAIGRLLWEKDLASGLNGNISLRVDENTLLLTATKTCLGLLQEKDILAINLDGTVLEEGAVSTEKLMHTEIYKQFPETQAVIHSHTTFTNAYFLENDTFNPRIFESKLWFGQITCVPQHSPSVTDAGPVIEALKTSSIMVLQNHGAVAVGKDLFDCFLLLQSLEEAIKMDAISRLYATSQGHKVTGSPEKRATEEKKFKLFSREQIDRIVELVNADGQIKDLGAKTQMTMDLAVKIEETGQVYRFSFEQGKIAAVNEDDQAEFVITAKEAVWRSVFNREVDPFVATTQKKMDLKGDFAKISKWYAPCSRIFELWQMVPVE